MTGVSPSALAGNYFLRGMSDDHLARLAALTSVVTVPAGHRFFTVGTVARHFWLIRAGQVAIDVDVPGQGRLVVQTLGRGEVIGVSWFFPPFQWQFGAVAVQATEAFQLDAAAVRERCDEDPDLGYQITRRLVAVVAKRLQATRLRMIEFCAEPDGRFAQELAGLSALGRPPPRAETGNMPAAYEKPRTGGAA
jgi:CRP-like cAMP-binding protein